MKSQYLLSILLASPLACVAADINASESASNVAPAPAVAAPSEANRDRISARIMEAYREDPAKPMMAPKTGEKSITELKPVNTPPPAPDSSDSAKIKAENKVVDLPAVEVKGRKETETTWEAKRQVVEADKKIAIEKEHTVASEADKILNAPAISVMGEASAKAREGDAKRRIHELEVKQSVAAVATDPKREKENKELLKELEDLEYQKRQH